MPQTDVSPNGSPSPFRLGFRPPSPESLQQDPIPSPAASPESPEDLSPAEPELASDGWDPDESYPESPDGTSSPASTPAPDVQVLDNEALRDMARAGVAIAGHQAHEHLARSEGQQRVGLYLTDEEDQAGIGDPLARIAARHQGIGKVNPDTQDALAAMVAIARYATKQVTLGRHAKQLDSAGAGTPQPMPEAVDL